MSSVATTSGRGTVGVPSARVTSRAHLLGYSGRCWPASFSLGDPSSDIFLRLQSDRRSRDGRSRAIPHREVFFPESQARSSGVECRTIAGQTHPPRFLAASSSSSSCAFPGGVSLFLKIKCRSCSWTVTSLSGPTYPQPDELQFRQNP